MSVLLVLTRRQDGASSIGAALGTGHVEQLVTDFLGRIRYGAAIGFCYQKIFVLNEIAHLGSSLANCRSRTNETPSTRWI